MPAKKNRPVRTYLRVGVVFVAGLFLLAAYFAAVSQERPKRDLSDKAFEAYDRANYRRTIKLLSQKSLEKRPNKILISAYLNSGRYEEAADSLEEILEDAGDDAEAATALYLLSLIAREQKDYEKAASLIQHATTIDQRPQLRLVLAEIYLEAGQNEQAVIELEQLLAGAPDEIDIAGVKSKLAAAYQGLGRPERARQVQQEATGEGTTP